MSRVQELIGCAISRYSPSAALRLGIAMNSPFSPSITLISWTTNSLSSVMDTMAFILPSFSILLTLTSVICINLTPLPSVHYNVNRSFFSMTIFKLSGVPMCVVLARMVSRLSTTQFSITVLSPIYTSFKMIEFLITQLLPT